MAIVEDAAKMTLFIFMKYKKYIFFPCTLKNDRVPIVELLVS